MPKKKNTTNPVDVEKLAEQEAEALAHDPAKESAEESNLDEEAEKATIVEIGADVDQIVPAEVAAIHLVDEPASKLEKKKAKRVDRQIAKKTLSVSKTEKKTRRSAKYLAAKVLVEVGKLYKLPEAIELTKKVSLTKFDGAVEIHLHLAKKKSKTVQESARGTVNLPHGSGKEKKIVVLDEAMIDEIATTKKINFDVAIASPALMPKVAKIARILGPVGKMPDPKSGTVTNDPDKIMTDIKAGKVEYRIDGTNNIHQIIGRVSWDTAKLEDNAKAMLGVLPKSRLAAAYLTATIGPAVPLDLTAVK